MQITLVTRELLIKKFIDHNEYRVGESTLNIITSKLIVCYSAFLRYKNEYDMVNMLANHGPLTVSVDATNWMSYQGGVIQYHCGQRANNHAVQIVGYNISGKLSHRLLCFSLLVYVEGARKK